jgi:hypothetical protein
MRKTKDPRRGRVFVPSNSRSSLFSGVCFYAEYLRRELRVDLAKLRRDGLAQ